MTARRSVPARAAAVIALGALSACAATVGGVLPTFQSFAPYQRSNAFAPSGYEERMVDETHFEVAARGTEATSPARVEKIALARAAEIGVEQRFDYFKVLNASHGIECRKKREVYRGNVPASRAPTVVMNVIYAKSPPPGDDGFKSAKDTFASLGAELSREVLDAQAAAANVADLKAKCGG